MKRLCLYHADCLDGLAAYWVVKEYFPDVEGHAAVYRNGPPWDKIDSDTEVFIVDFSYSLSAMQQLILQAARVTLIDHHPDTKLLVEQLTEWLHQFDTTVVNAPWVRLVYTDMDSGALLTWKTYFIGQPAPRLIRTISDYDTYQFAFQDTRQVIAGLRTYPMDYPVFDQLMHVDETELYDRLMVEGDTALRMRAMEISWAMEHTYREISFVGLMVPVVSVPKYLMNDCLDALLRSGRWPVVLGYHDTPVGRQYSVRTLRSEGVDARVFARPYGGSGHLTAAGFHVPFSHPLAQV